MSSDLNERWRNLWSRLNASGSGAHAFGTLYLLYSENHREYHNFGHISHCLNELDKVRGLVKDFDSVEFALWFHDAYYDTFRKDNKLKSAKLAVEVATGAGLSKDFLSRVERLILLSRHLEQPVENDAKLFVDIDLAILGQKRTIFEDFEKAIRMEYDWVPDCLYKDGRARVLSKFLYAGPGLIQRDVYSSDFFKSAYEDQARSNLYWAIEELVPDFFFR